MTNTRSDLEAILADVERADRTYSEDIERHYESLLLFLKANEDRREELGKELVSIVKSYRHARTGRHIRLSIDGLAYCMHELRWAEVETAVEEEHREYFSQRMSNTLARLQDSFRDGWSEASDYRCYRDDNGQGSD
jgi:hypothetical protein